MTTGQSQDMNTRLWQNIGQIADNENLMRRLSKYVAKLVKEKNDATLMTREQLNAKIERAEAAYERGEYYEKLPGEDLAAFLNRVGYGV